MQRPFCQPRQLASSWSSLRKPPTAPLLTARRIGQIVGNDCRLAASIAVVEGNAPFGCVTTDLDGTLAIGTIYDDAPRIAIVAMRAAAFPAL